MGVPTLPPLADHPARAAALPGPHGPGRAHQVDPDPLDQRSGTAHAGLDELASAATAAAAVSAELLALVGRLGGDPADAAAVAATLQPAELAQLDHLVRRLGVATAARVVAAHATRPGGTGVRGACRLAAVRLGWTRWLGR
jgi:hypothetical protein